MLSFALSMAGLEASASAFFGIDPQQGSLFYGGFSNGSVLANISGPGYTGGVLAGQFQGYFNPNSEPDGTLGPDDFFRFFCIDLAHEVDGSGGPDPYTRVTPTIDATRSAELSQLFDAFYPNKAQSTYYNGGNTTFGDFPDADSSAAFQLAVWEVLFDTNLDLTSGTFTATSSAAGLAGTYLSWIAGHPGDAPGWTFFEFTDDNFQSYLSVEYTQLLRTAPEPGSLLLLCSAVLAAGAAALRRRQTA